MITAEIGEGAVLAGRYRVIRRLGAGGMATVFLAEDGRLGREVAVKRLHTDAPEASLRRFRDEARLGAALNHPNLVSVYDTVAADEGALIVMEYVCGRPLSELSAGRPMPPSRALPVLEGVAAALDHAHSQGVVHRDVKPGNVIVADGGHVKLADLGIARAVGASRITSEGSVVGTLPYMSPERLTGPGEGGPESDVYAFAAVALELLSGNPPSTATSTEEAAARGPLHVREHWRDGPPRAVTVLERGLDHEAARRQPSAGRLVVELRAGLALRSSPADTVPAETAALPPRGRGTETTRVAKGGGRQHPHRVLAVGLLLVAIPVSGGVALSAGGGDSGPAEPNRSASKKGPGDPKPKPEQTAPAAAQEPAPEPQPEPPLPPASGVELNDLGFSLIEQGHYEEAVPVLRRAVDALKDGSDRLTYGYALYNLGRALRLAGDPDRAIPVLEERMAIPDQRGTVKRELEAAYAEAGGGGPPGPGSGPGKGGPPGHGEGHGPEH